MNSENPALLDFRNITVFRGATEALHSISLRVEVGEHVCILGPNGCGKSTLIQTITRDLYPVAGENSSITILGEERWEVYKLRTQLGIVSPDLLASCTSDVTGADIVLSGFFSSTRIFRHHRVEPQLLERVQGALGALRIEHLADRAVAEMSSGEAKRVLIARALVHQPKTLLFDEPSNSLDIGAQQRLRETMRELAQRGIGILLVTHHLADIIPEIERVVLLSQGRIVADGAKEEMLTAARLAALFGRRWKFRGGMAITTSTENVSAQLALRDSRRVLIGLHP
jgi:iron complex transport system ATP-binding protein